MRRKSVFMYGFHHRFPRAADYPFPLAPRMAGEPGGRLPRSFKYSERHLHCLWYDPAWRPALVDSRGEPVGVEQPGRWNLEAGPDFLDAVLVIGDGRGARRIRGDVEVHIRAGDWKHHGHADDPNYANVVAHVVWFPGTMPAGVLPPGCIEISLRDVVESDPTFAFEHLDLLAYPYEVDTGVHPLRGEISGWSRDQKEQFLDAAGEERLRRKTDLLQARIEEVGAEQALYEEVMVALGYKHNKRPFRALARALPLEELRAEAKSDPAVAYALLLGIANLLPGPEDFDADPETATLVRHAWDIWWKREEAFRDRVLPAESWQFGGVRPTNHPRRRLMAASHLFTQDQPLGEKLIDLERAKPKIWCRRAIQLLEVNTQTFWTRRLSLKSPPERNPIALVGKSRSRAILTNVFVPFLASQAEKGLFEAGLLDVLPVEASNQIVRETASAIFGPDHPSALYRTNLRRQGLLQVFYDYALGNGPEL